MAKQEKFYYSSRNISIYSVDILKRLTAGYKKMPGTGKTDERKQCENIHHFLVYDVEETATEGGGQTPKEAERK